MNKKHKKLPKHSGQPGRWRLLFVNDHGKTFVVRWIKFWFILLFLLVGICAAGGAGFYYLFQKADLENRELRTKLLRAEQEMEKLRGQKEKLIARLVIEGITVELEPEPEANRKTDPEKDKSAPADKDDDQGVEPAKTNHSENVSEKKVDEQPLENGAEEQKESPEANNPEENSPPGETNIRPELESDRVAVENLKISHDRSRDKLKIQFKLNNKHDQTVSGYLFTVLESDKESGQFWLALPSAPLNGSEPENYKDGRYFAISRFKTITFEAEDTGGERTYFKATILIFDDGGQLIFRKNYPVEM